MKTKLLALLKQERDFLSGEEIGKRLGVSRAAIWKNISKLKEEGYIVEAVTNKGYKLMPNKDLFNGQEIKDSLKSSYLGQEIIFLSQVTSTNDYLKALAEKGYKEGTVVVGAKQTNGKGRLGRQWSSSDEDCIYMSVLFRPSVAPASVSPITLMAGLSVSSALKDVTNLNANIKWPNDILIDSKKVCGILTELSAAIERVAYVVIGIGINVNNKEFPLEIEQTATSLFLESGRKFSRAEIISKVLFELEKNYITFLKEDGIGSMIERYKKECITLNRKVRVLRKEPFDGDVVDITSGGELIVRNKNGENVTVFSEEVSIRNI